MEISDADLEACLYGLPGVKPGRRKQAEPDWSAVARELKRKHVTLQVLWKNIAPLTRVGWLSLQSLVTCSGAGKVACL